MKHLVTVQGDIPFEQLQQITRMNPYNLINDNRIKTEFYELAGQILTFVSNWEDSQMNPNMMRAYSQKQPGQEAVNDYRESVRQELINESREFCLSYIQEIVLEFRLIIPSNPFGILSRCW